MRPKISPRVLDVQQVSDEQWSAFNDLWSRTWPPNPDQPSDPEAQTKTVSVIVLEDENAKLIGVCLWIDREITVNDAPQRIAGLGGVVVEEEFRGHGFGKLLIETAIADAKKRGYNWGVLFCAPFRQTFYEQFGWRVLRGEITQTRFGQQTGVLDDDLVMALPFTEEAAQQWPQWESARIHVGVGQW